jgi:tetratricopeptide (TPR) repeat protein
VHNLYVQAHLLRGRRFFQAGKYGEALKDYELALDYPERFEVGRPSESSGQLIEVEYHIGTAYEKLGDKTKAAIHFQAAIAPKLYGWSEISYYQGMANKQLGKTAEARRLFEGLVEFGRHGLERQTAEQFFSKFGSAAQENERKVLSHYLMGMGLQGTGKANEAKNEFQQVLRLDKNHLGAQTMLATLSSQ